MTSKTANVVSLADGACTGSPKQRSLLLKLYQILYFYSIAKASGKHRKSVSCFILQANQTFVCTKQVHLIVAFLVFSEWL